MSNFDTWGWRERGNLPIYHRQKKTKWLLLAGASDPPEWCDISKRRPRDVSKGGTFLHGTTRDLAKMERSLRKNLGETSSLSNSIRDLELTKSRARDAIKSCFEKSMEDGSRPVLYYSGHGMFLRGDWCFHDGTLTLEEIKADLPNGCYPLIIADTCFSGCWANKCTLVLALNSFQSVKVC